MSRRKRKRKGKAKPRKPPRSLEPLSKTALRLLKHIAEDSVTGCWNWTGAINDKQNELKYGRVWFHGKAEYAHRISYFVFVGDIDKDLEIMHLCDNERCINPKHLEQGTHKENCQYKWSEKLYGNGKPITRQIPIRFIEIIDNSDIPF